MKQILRITFIMMFCWAAKAQPGALDVSFGSGGKVLTNVDQTRNVANSVLVQPDGKIVVIGYSTPVDYTGYFTLVRYNTNGSLDVDFGEGGVVTTIINGNEDIAFSGQLQSDGKIIAAGYTWTGTDYDFAMVRYNQDGTRDLTFGVSGIVTAGLDERQEKANQVVIEPDGEIILVGFSGDEGNTEIDMAFAKFDANGNLNGQYGSNGIAIVPVSEPGLWESARAASLQTDGKMVAVGYTDVFDAAANTLYLNFAAVRLNDDGSLDESFGVGGIVRMAIEKSAIGTAVAVTTEGKILVLLETKVAKYGTTDFTLLRLDNTGSVDNSFGNNGFSTISFANSDDSGASLLLQSDHKILAAGYTAVNNGSTVDFAIARFDENGNLDNTFGSGGKVIVDFQGGLDFGGPIALQKDGRIVMAGAARVGDDFDFGVVRFENDSALPVKLLSFDARPEDSGVSLKWSTSFEINSSIFEIQRSADGLHWSVLDSIAAAHQSSFKTAYVFVDNKPLPQRSYYRLKMIDFDRTYSYSSVAKVYFKHQDLETTLAVYPNPTSGRLWLSSASKSEILHVQVLDANGNRRQLRRMNEHELDLSQLTEGIYNIIVTDREGRVSGAKVLLAK